MICNAAQHYVYIVLDIFAMMVMFSLDQKKCTHNNRYPADARRSDRKAAELQHSRGARRAATNSQSVKTKRLWSRRPRATLAGAPRGHDQVVQNLCGDPPDHAEARPVLSGRGHGRWNYVTRRCSVVIQIHDDQDEHKCLADCIRAAKL